MSNYDKFKGEVLDSSHWLVEHGYLGQLSSGGNISAKIRDEEILAITPSGRPYLQMVVDDICVIDFDGNPLRNGGDTLRTHIRSSPDRHISHAGTVMVLIGIERQGISCRITGRCNGPKSTDHNIPDEVHQKTPLFIGKYRSYLKNFEMTSSV